MIGLVPVALFVILIVQAFERQGVAAWGVGIAYIAYDTMLLAFTAWKILRLQHMQAPAPPGDSRPTMAVVLAAHNEASVLGITIDTLSAQTDPPDVILLADDGSSDDSAEILHRLYGVLTPPVGTMSDPAPGLPALRWLRLPHGGKANALNAAIPFLTADIMLTVDADTLLAPGALAAMRAAFAAEP
jgi:cellulose synthase/poly-beta-1,6-N-acetylglucosamine synthase-like glycosyltransferase